mmetsp:Transcript_16293/g.43684  ORF Transcript_16293/g.43684 Transcript_16293/m.43684 type:complete len:211 (-) Transcript_16293:109-741(-)|eukprot:CAMPEP_0184711016 /NCGR_PEP_ID=MMETSP0314-20130426/1721_1 /TAXON_ID=38298 /ORGANISM="Rhodella maculata, Strain CCMP 736" /LENGTH=210 /DNA_ID=CAMNT_0027173009 /DNA_START=78 /DNA_END=710 /DNA_ORIENTATION=-
MFAFVTSSAPLTSSFVARAVSTRPASTPAPVTMMAEMSKAVPFLEKPAKLDGSMAGDVGFDPLNFSNAYSLAWLREAELKHGRICMLAALGWVVPEFYHLPGEVFSTTNPLAAMWAVPKLGWIQIFMFIAACEAQSVDKLFYKKDFKEPGNYGFDPLSLKNARRAKSEVKNGRLAMIAMGGFIHQALLTNQGAIAQLKAGNFAPTAFPLH